MSDTGDAAKPSIGRELIQPFINAVKAPRALFGINLTYTLEGLAYFGVLGYLALFFSDFVFRGLERPNEPAQIMVGVLTAGITIAMLFLGTVADRKGVRFALIAAFFLLLAGRVLISSGPTLLGLEPAGLWSPLHVVTMAGILLVVIGYGMYMPACYAAVRQFTTPERSATDYAMLYALMNLGGWLPTFAFLIRDDSYLGLGIPGVFWVYTAITAVSLVAVLFYLTPSVIAQATAAAAQAVARAKGTSAAAETKPAAAPSPRVLDARVPWQMWLLVGGIMIAAYFRLPGAARLWGPALVAVAWLVLVLTPTTALWLEKHPLADIKFFFFIFALIPVQTLFTYNWLVIPPYVNRAFTGWIGRYFEIASNFNPILIFILAPIVASLTHRKKVYSMMIAGTFVMSAPAFLLAIGPYPLTLLGYLVLMTIGEAMWQPRFLQYAAEIAPEGRTGEYIGVAQLPWFLTKALVPWLYSGWMMDRYCPADGPKNTEFMWLIFGCIAISSTVMLLLARGWIGKDFKTKAE